MIFSCAIDKCRKPLDATSALQAIYDEYFSFGRELIFRRQATSAASTLFSSSSTIYFDFAAAAFSLLSSRVMLMLVNTFLFSMAARHIIDISMRRSHFIPFTSHTPFSPRRFTYIKFHNKIPDATREKQMTTSIYTYTRATPPSWRATSRGFR